LIHHYSEDDWSGDDNDDYIDDILCYQESLHSEIIDRCKFSNGLIINARLLSDKLILQDKFATINGTERQDPALIGKDFTNIQKNINKTYSTMLKSLHHSQQKYLSKNMIHQVWCTPGWGKNVLKVTF
jgi:hypothetical protein